MISNTKCKNAAFSQITSASYFLERKIKPLYHWWMLKILAPT